MAGACSCKSCCLGGLLPPEKQMAGACSCKSCCLGGLLPPEKQMAGACSCKSCCLGKALEACCRLKNRWQGHVAVRVVDLEACCRLKNRWQGHVAVRVVALERPAGGFEGFGLPFARLQTLQTLSQAFPRQQLLHLHAPAICFSGVQDCRLPGFKPFKPFRTPFQGNNSYSYMPHPSTCPCHLFFLLPAICFSGGSRLPFARLQTLQTLPQAFPRQQLLQLHAPAICFSGGSRPPS